MSESVQRISWAAAVVGACALFLAVLHGVGVHHQSFWADEATTISTISYGSLPELWSRIMASNATERLQPGYLLAAWLWLRACGWDFESLRWMSVAFFWLAMFLGWRLLKDRGLNREGACFAVLFGISPFWWFLAQEARSYTMALALVLLALWLQERPAASVRGGRFPFVFHLLVPPVVFLAAAANFYAILVWPVVATSDLLRNSRMSWRQVLVKHAVMACLTIPLFLNYANVSASGLPSPGTREFSPLAMAGLVHMGALGTSWGAPISELRMASRPMDAILAHGPWYLVSVGSLLLALIAALRLKAWRSSIPETILAVLSLGSIVWLSLRHGYPAAPRHLYLVAPALMAWGAVVLARRPAWIFPFLACCAVSSAQYLFNPAYAREDWRSAMEAIRFAPGYAPSSRIAFTQNDRFVFDLYLTRSIPGCGPRAEPVRGATSSPVNCAAWADPSPPDFLIEARTWEVSPAGRRTLDRLKAQMVIYHRTSGITVWRSPNMATSASAEPW